MGVRQGVLYLDEVSPYRVRQCKAMAQIPGSHQRRLLMHAIAEALGGLGVEDSGKSRKEENLKDVQEMETEQFQKQASSQRQLRLEQGLRI